MTHDMQLLDRQSKSMSIWCLLYLSSIIMKDELVVTDDVDWKTENYIVSYPSRQADKLIVNDLIYCYSQAVRMDINQKILNRSHCRVQGTQRRQQQQLAIRQNYFRTNCIAINHVRLNNHKFVVLISIQIFIQISTGAAHQEGCAREHVRTQHFILTRQLLDFEGAQLTFSQNLAAQMYN